MLNVKLLRALGLIPRQAPSLGNGSFKANVFLHGVLSGTTTFGVSR